MLGWPVPARIYVGRQDRETDETGTFSFSFSKPSLISSPCDDAAMLRHAGERRGCGAHPGVVGDEEEDCRR
jgi:hypothetical protein